MQKYFLIAFLFFVEVNINAQQKQIDTCYVNIKTKQCLTLLQGYQNFWEQDSLGKNGVRYILSYEFLEHCDCFVGNDWEKIKGLLGKPISAYKSGANFVYHQNEILYQYVVYSSRGYKNYAKTGNIYLKVYVADGKIVKYFLYEIDG